MAAYNLVKHSSYLMLVTINKHGVKIWSGILSDAK